ncbi:NAD-dependent epimerase/dehydratase family protein [Mycolicibacterium thermoresistibile]
MTGRRALVMGASGFLGSHVTRTLVARGDEVRVLLRETSDTRGIDDLEVERRYGDVFDDAAVRAAMADRDIVYYCVVDARAWLRDPAPLVRTNVEGLRRVLDIAAEADLHRFVFTSTIGTIAIGATDRPVTEDTPFDWAGRGGPYIASRRQAEELTLEYARAGRVPAVAMCVSNTYGPGDWVPTPHGAMVAAVALGKMPFYMGGVGSEVVGVEDAAEAMLLAADRGRIGERYIISERYLTQRAVFDIAAAAVGVEPPRFGVPLPVLYGFGAGATAVGKMRGRDYRLNLNAVRLLDLTAPLDHSKATAELGWQPGPAAEAIRRAARFHVDRRRQRRAARS